MVHSSNQFSQEEIGRARHNRFTVHQRRLKLKPPVNWARDPYESRRFRGALNTLGWLDVLFFDFQENNRITSLRKARDLALDWIRSNRPGTNVTDRTWDDRITATRATYLAYAMRASACRGLLSDHKRTIFSRSIAYHGKRASSKKHYKPTNHGLYVDTNLILLARAVPNIAEGKGWAKTAKRRFGRTLRGRIFEREGFWLEHSASYQFAVRREVAFFRQIASGDAFEPLFKRMTDIAGWFLQPDERLTLLGSSTHGRPIPQDVKQEAQDDDGMRYLGRSGLAFVKRPGAYLSLATTFFNSSHKDSDELSFDLFGAGHRIVTDSGEYDKDGGRWGRFSDSPSAHSTLTVDGKGFSRNARDAYGSGLIARGEGDGWYAFAASNPLLRDDGAKHTRILFYRPSRGLIVVDRVRSKHRHTYRRFIQLGSDIQASRSGGGVDLAAAGFSGRLTDDTRGGDPTIDLVKGRRQPSILGFEFPAFRERVPRTTALLRTTSEDLNHAAVLSLDSAESMEAKVLRASAGLTRVELRIAGAPVGTLEAERENHKLDVRLQP